MGAEQTRRNNKAETISATPTEKIATGKKVLTISKIRLYLMKQLPGKH